MLGATRRAQARAPVPIAQVPVAQTGEPKIAQLSPDEYLVGILYTESRSELTRNLERSVLQSFQG